MGTPCLTAESRGQSLKLQRFLADESREMPIQHALLALIVMAGAAVIGLYARRLHEQPSDAGDAGTTPHPRRDQSEDGPSLSSSLALLSAVADLAVSSQSAETIANGILDEMHGYRPFDRITLSVVDSNRREIVVRAQAGAQDADPGAASVSNGVPGKPDFGLLGWKRPSQCWKSQDPGTTLAIPLNHGKSLLGVLKIEAHNGRISPLEAQVAAICGALLASSLHSAALSEERDRHSVTDDLTGGRTRQYFLDALQREWKFSARHDRPFSIVMLTLGGLKAVRSALGPLERDLILARVGRLLEHKCRRSNLLARYDEDTFVLLMPETRPEQAQALAQRLQLWVEADPVLKEREITGRFGLATYPLDGLNLEDLLKRACQRNGLAVTGDIHISPPR